MYFSVLYSDLDLQIVSSNKIALWYIIARALMSGALHIKVQYVAAW